MEDDYAQFVDLCMQLCFWEDYLDKKKLRRHNAAMAKLDKLEEKLKRDASVETIERLLYHEDERVRLNAAATCLKKMGVLKDEANGVLNDIIASESADKDVRFSASMLLEQQDPNSIFFGK